jgi:Predicted RNA-binding protein (contains KH domains)
MTRQEASGILMAEVEQELRNEVARKVRDSELAARDESERRAREIVTESIQRIAADQTAEVSVSVLPLPTDELKGRIIGKEGRNIRALQQATGIDLIVDDTPEAVIISGFDPVRREVARVALNKLIVDGEFIRHASKRSWPSPARRSCRGSRRRGRLRSWRSAFRVFTPRSSAILES